TRTLCTPLRSKANITTNTSTSRPATNLQTRFTPPAQAPRTPKTIRFSCPEKLAHHTSPVRRVKNTPRVIPHVSAAAIRDLVSSAPIAAVDAIAAATIAVAIVEIVVAAVIGEADAQEAAAVLTAAPEAVRVTTVAATSAAVLRGARSSSPK